MRNRINETVRALMRVYRSDKDTQGAVKISEFIAALVEGIDPANVESVCRAAEREAEGVSELDRLRLYYRHRRDED